ncbi:hypothetical protein ACYEXS_07430 [Paenibacillus sp. MAH-36]|uniref:Copper amine oxidase-like protein n=1 Tax=Paenibacillus violae TaxID=3077234 RepID=A0ABU3R9U2_9BACL|nr:hypothetical protein [Paenibacillus sp. PFR10]MDU0201044.1 hypothetical protein [Paenibacillus sp. PFR10]
MRNRKVAVMLLACCFVIWNGRSLAEASSVGERVGEVVSTDIAAYVNGKQIPSMNIAGETAIAVEDLRESGFDVSWSPRARTLRIAPKAVGEQAPVDTTLMREPATLPIGTHLKDVLYTDIQAYYGDTPVRSFNIDGRTAILLNDLYAFGTVTWNEVERTIQFQAKPIAESGTQEAWREAGANLMLHSVKNVSFSLDFREEGQFYEDEQVGFGENGLPYMKLDFFADKFGFAKHIDRKNTELSDGLYSFSIQPGSEQAITYWGGEAVHTSELIFPPQVKDGDIYLYSIDLERLFGYIGKWNQDSRNLLIRYTSYDVKDYGLPTQEPSDKLTVKAVVTEPPWDFSLNGGMALKLDNDNIFGNLNTAMQKTGAADERVSWMEAPIRLHLGDNRITTELAQGDRILYSASYPVKTSYEAVPLNVGIPGFKLDQTEVGYIKTDASTNTLTGKADSSFAYGVSKFEEGQGLVTRASSPVQVEVKDGKFQMPLTLSNGNGLYQVQLYRPVATPRGPGYSNEGYFYVMLLQP